MRDLLEPIWAKNVTTAEIMGTVGPNDIPKLAKNVVFDIRFCSVDLISMDHREE